MPTGAEIGARTGEKIPGASQKRTGSAKLLTCKNLKTNQKICINAVLVMGKA